MVVEGLHQVTAVRPADVFEVMIGGLHAVLPGRVVFAGWVPVVPCFEELRKARDIDSISRYCVVLKRRFNSPISHS